jgi:hypothetical protein
MSKSNTWETNILQLLFTATAIPNIADNTGTSPLSNLWVSLHTSDPGETGNQSTNEANYTGYVRVTVSRSSSGWTISGATSSNSAAVTFAEATGGSSVVSHFGVGGSYSGAGNLYYSGAVTANLTVTSGITPYFAAQQLTVYED